MIRKSILSLLLVSFGFSSLPAERDILRPVTYQSSINQKGLKDETEKLQRELNAILDDLRRNGFPPNALGDVEIIIAQLGYVSGMEMQEIADTLLAASQSASLDDTRRTAGQAYEKQQTIEARLRNIARTLAIRHLREDIQRQIERLIVKQLTIRRELAGVLNNPQRGTPERHQLSLADQRSVRVDLDTILQTGENLAVRLQEEGRGQADNRSFRERVNGDLLVRLANRATDQVEERAYREAFPHQDNLLIELRKLLLALQSSQNQTQRLSAALLEAQSLREQQQALADRQAEQQITPEDQRRQEQLANQVDTLAASVAQVDQEATRNLAQARQEMNRNAQQQTEDNSAAQAAADALTEAIASLEQNLADSRQQEQNAAMAANEAVNSAMSAAQEAAQALQTGQQESGADDAQAAADYQAASEALQTAMEQTRQAAQSSQQSGTQSNPEIEQALAEASQALSAANQATSAQNQEAAQENISRAQNALSQASQQLAASNPATEDAGSQMASSDQRTADGQPPQPGQQQHAGLQSGGEMAGAEGEEFEGGATGVSSGELGETGPFRGVDRSAMESLQSEAYPDEYADWIQQYWRNLTENP